MILQRFEISCPIRGVIKTKDLLYHLTVSVYLQLLDCLDNVWYNLNRYLSTYSYIAYIILIFYYLITETEVSGTECALAYLSPL